MVVSIYRAKVREKLLEYSKISIFETWILWINFPLSEYKSSHRDFVHLTKEKEVEFYENATELSVEQMEDIYWEKVGKFEGHYAVDNLTTMFSKDVMTWNLDRLTKRDSKIHAGITHHKWSVSHCYFETMTIYLYNI